MDREMQDAGLIRRNVEEYLENSFLTYANNHRSCYFSQEWHYEHWLHVDNIIFTVFDVTDDREDRYHTTIANLKRIAKDVTKAYDGSEYLFLNWIEDHAVDLTQYVLYGKEF